MACSRRSAASAPGRAEPAPPGTDFTLTINTQGRLITPEQFKQIIVKTGDNGQIVYLADVARVELGAKDYSVQSYLDGKPAVALGIFQLPGSNALATAHAVRAKMKELSASFPTGLQYDIVYDPTVFIQESINAVYHTLFEAIILVLLVVLVFLLLEVFRVVQGVVERRVLGIYPPGPPDPRIRRRNHPSSRLRCSVYYALRLTRRTRESWGFPD